MVVDVTNHNAKVWFDQAANFYTGTVHVVERFTLAVRNTIPLVAIQSAAFVFWKRPATRENAIPMRSFALVTRSV